MPQIKMITTDAAREALVGQKDFIVTDGEGFSAKVNFNGVPSSRLFQSKGSVKNDIDNIKTAFKAHQMRERLLQKLLARQSK